MASGSSCNGQPGQPDQPGQPSTALVAAEAQAQVGPAGLGQALVGPAGQDLVVASGGDPPASSAVKWARCMYDCGPPRPLTELFRSNPRANPQCHPCHNAARAIKAMASKSEGAKAALAKLQSEDPELWKAKVRGCRIVDFGASGSAGQPGVANVSLRRQQISNFLVSLTQVLGVEDRGGVKWLKESEFLTRMVNKERMTEEEAKALWDKKASESGVMQIPGDDVRVPVIKAPETSAYRKRELANTVTTQVSIDSQAQADDAMRQLANVGVGMSSLNNPLFSDMTAALRPGVAAGSSSGQPIPLGSLQAPPAGMVVPASNFEGLAPKAKRSLASQISEPLEEVGAPTKKRKGGSAALSGVTGQLLKLRQHGLDASSRLWDQYGKQGKNVARQVEACARSAGQELSKDVAKAVENYVAGIAAAKQVGQQVKKWTADDANDNLLQLASLAESLERDHKTITAAMADIKVGQEKARKELTKQRYEATKVRTRHLSAYKGSAPDVLVRFLYDHGALVSSTASAVEKTNVDDETQPESQEVRDQPLCELASRCPVVTPGETEFHAHTPALFPAPDASVTAADNDVGEKVRSVLEHIGMERIMAAEKDCVRVMSNTNTLVASKRMEPKGQPVDTLELMEWVPEHWRASKTMPEALRGMGAPKLLVSATGGCRYLHESWTMPGIGQFVIAVRGHTTLAMWPGNSVIALGCALADMPKFLFSDMGHKNFGEWASDHLRYVNLVPGASVWLPYGWYGAMVTRPGTEGAASLVAQPYVTKALASRCHWWLPASKHLLSMVADLVENGPKAWKQCGPEAIEWLQQLGPVERFSAPRSLLDIGSAASAAGSASAGGQRDAEDESGA